MYWQDLDPAHFLSGKIMPNYPNRDFHRAYFGEILRVRGSREFRRKLAGRPAGGYPDIINKRRCLRLQSILARLRMAA